MRVVGNAEDPGKTPALEPPAGGFGAEDGPSSTKGPHPFGPSSRNPVRDKTGSLHVLGIGIGCVVLAFVVFLLYMEHRKREAAKWAEAVLRVGEVTKKVKESYDRDHELCPSAAAVPHDFELVRGKSYRAKAADWESDPGWKCLGYATTYPTLYQLQYERTGEFFTVRAVGDIDGNDVRSTYTFEGHIDPDSHELVMSPNGVQSTNKGE